MVPHDLWQRKGRLRIDGELTATAGKPRGVARSGRRDGPSACRHRDGASATPYCFGVPASFFGSASSTRSACFFRMADALPAGSL